MKLLKCLFYIESIVILLNIIGRCTKEVNDWVREEAYACVSDSLTVGMFKGINICQIRRLLYAIIFFMWNNNVNSLLLRNIYQRKMREKEKVRCWCTKIGIKKIRTTREKRIQFPSGIWHTNCPNSFKKILILFLSLSYEK